MKFLLIFSIFGSILSCTDDQLAQVNKVFTGKLLRNIKDIKLYKSTVFDSKCAADTYRIAHFQEWNKGQSFAKEIIDGETRMGKRQIIEKFHLHSMNKNGCEARAIDCESMAFTIYVSDNGRKKIANLDFDCVPQKNHEIIDLAWVKANVLLGLD